MNDDTREELLRAAARRHRSDVADVVDLDAAHRRVVRPRRTGLVAAAVLAVVALAGAAVWLQADDGDVEVAVEEDEDSRAPTTSRPDVDRPAPDADAMPTPIALGAANDGRDSVGLPVDADPKSGLVDGQTVTVHGAGFPPSADVGVVMCTKEAGRDHGGRGVEACDLGNVGYGTTDAQGKVSVEFQVRRLLVLDGQEVDCASEAQRCLIGMGLISDYDQSGGVLVDFDGSVPLPDPPTIQVSKTTGLSDGETVRVRVDGLPSNSEVWIVQCIASDGSCADMYAPVATDSQGVYEGELPVWRLLGTWAHPLPRTVDCAVETCQLVVNSSSASVSGTRAVPPVELSFDPNTESRPIPLLMLVDEQPLARDQPFRVRLDGLAGGSVAELQVCNTTGDCRGGASGPASDGTYLFAAGSVPTGWCAADCFVSAYIYPTGNSEHGIPDPATPPPLFPEPLPVTFAG